MYAYGMALPPGLASALAHFQAGRWRDAEELAAQAVAGRPEHPEAAYLYGVILARRGAFSEAVPFLRRASQAKPADVERLAHLCRAMLSDGQAVAAVDAAGELVRRAPSMPEAHVMLASAARLVGNDDGAIESLRSALKLNPRHLDAMRRLASLLNLRADHAEARELFDRALAQAAGDPVLAAEAAWAANAWSGLSAEDLFGYHQQVARRIAAAPPLPLPPLANSQDLGRRLRIAYMTPDSRAHPAAAFMEAIFEHHDRATFEILLYANVARGADETSRRFEQRSHRYRVFTGLTERQAADLIREDTVDVLVDLAGLTEGSGVWLLRNRIAPVQVTYLGYPNTCAMPCADVRLIDAVTDPVESDQFATERLVRLDPCFLCYTPPVQPPDPAPLHDGRPFTFGSFNALHKHSPAAIDLFAAALSAVPGSRLVVKAKALASAGAQQGLAAAFAQRGLDPARLELLPFVPDSGGHLSTYRRVDVALDTTPYSGTTTTCETLLMGVPVVTLLGDRHAARVSASLLSAVGGPHAELVAQTPGDFVRIAASLAEPDAPLTRSLGDRAVNRQRFLASPLCDGPRFVRELEAAYRAAWQRWCQEK
jgi:protein O-GlcNAc transferase